MDLFSDRAALSDICRKYRVKRLSLFGSVLRGTATDKSDVDLLVEFDEDKGPTFIDVANLEIELSGMLRGRKVDVRTAGDLSRYFREEVVAAAELQYAA